MNIRRILWVLVPILFRITLAHAQTTDNARALTEETLRVEASSATVQQWLSRIETGLGIVISYNPAQIDVDKVRRIDRPGVYTVGALLSKVLDGYKVRTAFVPPRKLLIQAEKIENVCLGGTVLEEESGERLYGAVVSVDNGGGCHYRRQRRLPPLRSAGHLCAQCFLYGICPLKPPHKCERQLSYCYAS